MLFRSIEMSKANLFSALFMVSGRLKGQAAFRYSWVSLRAGVGKMAFSKVDCQDPLASCTRWIELWNSFILTVPGGHPVTFKAYTIEDSQPWRCQAKIACRLPSKEEDKVVFFNAQMDKLLKENDLQGHYSRVNLVEAKKWDDGRNVFLSWSPDECMLSFLQKKAVNGLVKVYFMGGPTHVKVFNLQELKAQRKAKGQNDNDNVSHMDEDEDDEDEDGDEAGGESDDNVPLKKSRERDESNDDALHVQPQQRNTLAGASIVSDSP